MGRDLRLPPLPWLHPRPGFVPQFASRRSHGYETEWRHGQHDHENRTLDIPHVPHVHSLSDRSAVRGRRVEDVDMFPVPKCQLT